MVRYHPVANEQYRPAVDFSVVLSPTYRVPVLWFSLSSVKVARVSDLEEIYSRVVVAGSYEALRGTGIMGGISLAVSENQIQMSNFRLMILEPPNH